MKTFIAEDGRQIIIRGVGKLFYQDGFPISMSISVLKKKGWEVSLFHVADECMKNGWSPKTTFNKLVADFEDDIDGNVWDKEQVRKFCYASYEEQREMIFNYLFKDVEEAKQWLRRISVQTGT